MNRLLPVAALLLLCFASGCATFDNVERRIARTSDFLAGKRPNTFVRMMEDKNSPDARRIGINRLVEYDFAQKAPYTDRYRQIAQSDPDDLVRATALRALNRSRDRSATDLFITALKDPNDLVRLEGAKALIHVPDPKSSDVLTAIVNRPDENRDVRIAAAEALKHYANIDVARALVGRLNEREFGVAYQSRRSLKSMTKKDLGYDQSAWLSYLTGPTKPFG